MKYKPFEENIIFFYYRVLFVKNSIFKAIFPACIIETQLVTMTSIEHGLNPCLTYFLTSFIMMVSQYYSSFYKPIVLWIFLALKHLDLRVNDVF